MYVPPAFAEHDPEALKTVMLQCSLPILISPVVDGGDKRIWATHLPLIVEDGRLLGHVARANEHWKMLERDAESLAIFSAADGYVSPSFYASKQETGRVVPTWNYEAVHAYGSLEVVQDKDRVLDIITRLTNRYESSRARPWSVDDAPADYISMQLKGIVGLVLHVTRLVGSRKLSQNKTEADRNGVVTGLSNENPCLAHQMILASKGGR